MVNAVVYAQKWLRTAAHRVYVVYIGRTPHVTDTNCISEEVNDALGHRH